MSWELNLIVWAFLSLMFLILGLVYLLSTKPDSIIDFLMTDAEIQQYENFEKNLKTQKLIYDDLNQYHQDLLSYAKVTRKNSDGTYDRRSRYGDVLNRDLPVISKKLKLEKKIYKKLLKTVARFKNIYTIRKRRWVLSQSFQYAFLRSVPFAALLLIGAPVVTHDPDDSIVFLLPTVLLCYFFFWFRDLLIKEIETHESAYLIKNLVP